MMCQLRGLSTQPHQPQSILLCTENPYLPALRKLIRPRIASAASVSEFQPCSPSSILASETCVQKSLGFKVLQKRNSDVGDPTFQLSFIHH